MYLKINKKPKLKKVSKMLCDENLDEKLNKYDILKFFNCHSTILFIGKPGSGKTSLLITLFSNKNLLKKVYHNIYLFQPSHSRASLKKNIFEDIENKYDDLTYANLKEVIELIKNEDNKYCNCIIFDDMTAYLKDNEIKKLLKELIFNKRHLRTSVFFLCQTYLSVERDIRKLFNNLVIFNVSPNEYNLIMEENIQMDKLLLEPIRKFIFNEPYNFMFINTNSNRIFKNWDEIIYDEK